MKQFKNSRTLMGVTTKNRNLFALLCCLEELNYEVDAGVCAVNYLTYWPFKLNSRKNAPVYPSRILVTHYRLEDSFKIFIEPNTIQTENFMRFVGEKMPDL